MPEEEKKENMVDVGEADQEATEINLDEQAKENEKKEVEVEEAEDKRTYEYQKDHGTDKSYENERESKLDDGEKKDELK